MRATGKEKTPRALHNEQLQTLFTVELAVCVLWVWVLSFCCQLVHRRPPTRPVSLSGRSCWGALPRQTSRPLRPITFIQHYGRACFHPTATSRAGRACLWGSQPASQRLEPGLSLVPAGACTPHALSAPTALSAWPDLMTHFPPDALSLSLMPPRSAGQTLWKRRGKTVKKSFALRQREYEPQNVKPYTKK